MAATVPPRPDGDSPRTRQWDPVTDTPTEASYRALASVPSLARALAGMQISRIGQSMVGIALVLFTLDRYHSPALAGFVTFVSLAPGIAVSPIAGAILDRHGRTRFIVLDFVIAMLSLVAIGVLAAADLLPPWLLILIAALSALTGPLSATGLRSLFPLMAPRHLWERLNAIDSNGYVVATIFGPPLAAAAVALLGGPIALILIGLVFGAAAVILWPVPDPETNPNSSGSLLRDAWLGLRYTWSNRTLRGLGFSITTLNLAGGMTTIVVPLIVLNRLGLTELAVGGVFAVQGVFGMVSGLIAGRLDTRGRERGLIAWPMLVYAPAVALLLIGGSVVPIVIAMALMGIINGPMDVAMFTLRQRRTDPAWLGRAFAVSMSFNFAGYPIGSAIAGALASWSLDAAIGLGVVACLVAALFAVRLIPVGEPAP
jgi:MFS family permease